MDEGNEMVDKIVAGLLRAEGIDERETEEIAFAAFYEASYNHGTDGHIRLVVIAKMRNALYEAAKLITGFPSYDASLSRSEDYTDTGVHVPN